MVETERWRGGQETTVHVVDAAKINETLQIIQHLLKLFETLKPFKKDDQIILEPLNKLKPFENEPK